MNKKIRILLVDDSLNNIKLIIQELRQGGFDPLSHSVATRQEMEAALDWQPWDIVITSDAIPHLSAIETLMLLKERRLDLPFIVVSDDPREAPQASGKGAISKCFVNKNDSTRLLQVVNQELRKAASRKEHEHTEEQLIINNVQYHALLETISVGVAFIDTSGNIKDFNDALIRAGGYTRADMAGRGNMADLFLNPRQWQEISENINKQGLPHKKQLRLSRKDGTAYDALLSLIPLEIKGQTYWQAVVEDLTQHKEAAKEVKRAVGKLQRALEGVVQTMSLVVEAKDPFTAGHQRRVALIACAIAKEMGLPNEQVNGIRIAGLLHDTGKIWLPEDIHHKPDKLTEVEMSSIKIHPQITFDILKTIEFPWPIAQTALQHHERMDGSGYPFGITGNNILLEAKILAVADVVEAMSSDRPYRQALGTGKVLEEITRKKGTLYDPEVVDACVKHINENGLKPLWNQQIQ